MSEFGFKGGFRKYLGKEIKTADEKKLKAAVDKTRVEEKTARADRKQELKANCHACATQRREVFEVTAEQFKRAVEKARADRHAARARARLVCTRTAQAITAAAGDRIGKAQHERKEVLSQAELLKRGEQQARRLSARTSAKERRAESDDEVISNIEPQYVALFQEIRSTLKGSPRWSRTEQFLHYVHEHPDETMLAIERQVQRELEREFGRHARMPKRSGPRSRHHDLDDVPF